jgi:cytochrome P450
MDPDAEYFDKDKGIRKFIPFSDGQRDCIGQSFAKMNYMAMLTRLYGNFTFKLAHPGGVEAVEAEQRCSPTLTPSKGIWMQAIPRVPIAKV